MQPREEAQRLPPRRHRRLPRHQQQPKQSSDTPCPRRCPPSLPLARPERIHRPLARTARHRPLSSRPDRPDNHPPQTQNDRRAMEQWLQPLWRSGSTTPSTTTLAADIPAHLKSQTDVKRTLTSLLQKLLMCVAELGDVLALNLFLCRRLAAAWSYGFIRSIQPIGFQWLQSLVHTADCASCIIYYSSGSSSSVGLPSAGFSRSY